MKRLLLALVLLVPSLAFAQVFVGKNLGWDQVATTAAEAASYTYLYFPDKATVGIPMVGVTCAGSSGPFQCQAPFPAFTPGEHTMTLAASNSAGTSAESVPLTFIFTVVPGTPINLRILP